MPCEVGFIPAFSEGGNGVSEVVTFSKSRTSETCICFPLSEAAFPIFHAARPVCPACLNSSQRRPFPGRRGWSGAKPRLCRPASLWALPWVPQKCFDRRCPLQIRSLMIRDDRGTHRAEAWKEPTFQPSCGWLPPRPSLPASVATASAPGLPAPSSGRHSLQGDAGRSLPSASSAEKWEQEWTPHLRLVRTRGPEFTVSAVLLPASSLAPEEGRAPSTRPSPAPSAWQKGTGVTWPTGALPWAWLCPLVPRRDPHFTSQRSSTQSEKSTPLREGLSCHGAPASGAGSTGRRKSSGWGAAQAFVWTLRPGPAGDLADMGLGPWEGKPDPGREGRAGNQGAVPPCRGGA